MTTSRSEVYIDPRSGMLARGPFDPKQTWIGPLKRRPVEAKPCLNCGVLTERIVIGAICEKVRQPGEPPQESDQISPGSIGYNLHRTHWEHLSLCEACERVRNIAQARAIVANEQVLPAIRERCAAWLAAQERAAA